MKHTKLSLVGAGNIGGTLALMGSLKGWDTVTLCDIDEGPPSGKAKDITHAMALEHRSARITGTADLSALQDSDVVIITAGSPRKPGMSRDDLLKINTQVMVNVGKALALHCPQAFVIVITNPLDAMVWVLQEVSGLPKEKVVGMAGVLDSARFRHHIAEACHVAMEDVTAFVLGGHGDSMVPLVRYATVAGIPLPQLVTMGWLSPDTIQDIVEKTRHGGAEIVQLLQTGSAFYAPASSALTMAEAYIHDQKRVLPCAAWCEGVYGLSGMYMGVPIILGQKGVEKIIDVPLEPHEKQALTASAESVKHLMDQARGYI